MKTTWKRRLSAFLAMLLVISTLLGAMPAAASAKSSAVKVGSTFTSGQLKYKVTAVKGKSGNVSVIGVKNKSIASVTLPNTVKKGKYKFNVTAIASKAFKGLKKLKVVNTNKNLKTIGSNAFNGCKNLQKVNIKGTKVTSVGKNALKGISKKAVIQVPAEKKSAYASILKNKGQSSSVKVASTGTAAQTTAAKTATTAQKATQAPKATTAATAQKTTVAQKTTEVQKTTEAPKAKTLQVTAPQATEPETQATETPRVTEPETQATEAQKAAEPETQATEAQKAVEPETQATEAPKATEPETQATEAPKATGPETQATEAPKATEPETQATEAPKATEPETQATEAPKASEPETEEPQITIPETEPETQTTEAQTEEVTEAQTTEAQTEEVTEAQTTEAQTEEVTEAQTTEAQTEEVTEEQTTEAQTTEAPVVSEKELPQTYPQQNGKRYEVPRFETPGVDGPSIEEPNADEPKADETNADVLEPKLEATEPETQATEPETEATEPETQATEPETQMTESETQMTEPETEATEPETQATEPETQVTEHVHNYNDWQITKAATCTDAGEMTRTCADCGAVETEAIAAKGHSLGEWELENIPGLNCYARNVRRCTACDYVEKNYTPIHRTDVLEKLPDIEPTCTTAGQTNRGYCPYCGQEFFGYVKPLGHEYSDEVTVEPGSCVKAEISYRKCIRCDARTGVTELAKATGHQWENVSIAPTCTEAGFEGKRCSLCGAEDGKQITAAGHKYETTLVEAKCGEDGFKDVKCSVCGQTTHTILPATGKHRWVSYPEVQATCVEDGHTAYTQCSICGKYQDGEPEIFKATGVHQWTTDIKASYGLMSISEKVNSNELTLFENQCETCGCYRIKPGSGLTEESIKKMDHGQIYWILFLKEDGGWDGNNVSAVYCGHVYLEDRCYASYLAAIRGPSEKTIDGTVLNQNESNTVGIFKDIASGLTAKGDGVTLKEVYSNCEFSQSGRALGSLDANDIGKTFIIG